VNHLSLRDFRQQLSPEEATLQQVGVGYSISESLAATTAAYATGCVCCSLAQDRVSASTHRVTATMEPDRLAEFVQLLNMLTMDEVLSILSGPTGRRAHQFQAVLRTARAAKPNAVEQALVVKHEVPAPTGEADYQPSGLSGNATQSVDSFRLGSNPQGDTDEANILDFRLVEVFPWVTAVGNCANQNHVEFARLFRTLSQIAIPVERVQVRRGSSESRMPTRSERPSPATPKSRDVQGRKTRGRQTLRATLPSLSTASLRAATARQTLLQETLRSLG
jgi:hypothetical protein